MLPVFLPRWNIVCWKRRHAPCPAHAPCTAMTCAGGKRAIAGFNSILECGSTASSNVVQQHPRVWFNSILGCKLPSTAHMPCLYSRSYTLQWPQGEGEGEGEGESTVPIFSLQHFNLSEEIPVHPLEESSVLVAKEFFCTANDLGTLPPGNGLARFSAFGGWTRFTVSNGKKSGRLRGKLLVTRIEDLQASRCRCGNQWHASEQMWEPCHAHRTSHWLLGRVGC
jgi:hypothetical protein